MRKHGKKSPQTCEGGRQATYPAGEYDDTADDNRDDIIAIRAHDYTRTKKRFTRVTTRVVELLISGSRVRKP